MTPERWRQFEDLFHAARERASGDREAFLVEACAGDATLLREVESLLAQQDGTLLPEGVAAVAATLVTSLARHNHEGRTLGGYLLGPLLGRGGMGDVYCARDSKLGRDVAVEILPDVLGHHPERLRRFQREARVLAALNHPHMAQSTVWRRATAFGAWCSSSSTASAEGEARRAKASCSAPSCT